MPTHVSLIPQDPCGKWKAARARTMGETKGSFFIELFEPGVRGRSATITIAGASPEVLHHLIDGLMKIEMEWSR